MSWSLFGRPKATVEEVKQAMTDPISPSPPPVSFEQELTGLINKYSLENLSNTPDFILAFYLKDCLVAWQNAQQRRTQWYSKKIEEKVYASDLRPSQHAPLE